MIVKTVSGLVPFSRVVDRFLPGGYRDGMDLESALAASKKIKGLDAVALDYPMSFMDPVEIKKLLDKYDVQMPLLEMGIYGERKWMYGSFAAVNPATRKEAIKLGKRCVDVAAELDIYDVLLWPGQDGYEYPMQANYQKIWGYLVEGIQEIAVHRPEVKIAVEYKPKEPRVRCFVDTVGKALLLCEEIGLDNVGIAVDTGHAFNALENPGYSAALASHYNRLFEVHVNDNYGDWDSDMLVGQINFWTTLDFFYWLQKVGWDGYYVMDFFPYREDGPRALEQMIKHTKRFVSMAQKLVNSPLEDLQNSDDPIEIIEMLWKTLINYD